MPPIPLRFPEPNRALSSSYTCVRTSRAAETRGDCCRLLCWHSSEPLEHLAPVDSVAWARGTVHIYGGTRDRARAQTQAVRTHLGFVQSLCMYDGSVPCRRPGRILYTQPFCTHYQESPYMSRGSSVSIVSDYGLDDRGSISDRGKGFFLLSLRLDRLWGPSSLLSNGYWGSYPMG
jgi:hypothetical protein